MWEHTWAKYLEKQRKMGSTYIQHLTEDLRFKLGLPTSANSMLRNIYRPRVDQLLKDDVGRFVRYGGYREEETRQ